MRPLEPRGRVLWALVAGRSRDGAPEALCVLYVRTTGLTTRHAQVWSQDSARIAGTTESGDKFGSSLTP